MKKPSKRQHWVPRFYLKHFAEPNSRRKENPQVWCLRKNEQREEPRLTGVQNVAVKKNVYTLYGENRKPDYSLDDDFTETEGLVSQIWPPLVTKYFDENSLLKGTKKILSLFLAQLLTRHIGNKELWQKIHREIVALNEREPMPLEVRDDFNRFKNTSDQENWQNYLHSIKPITGDLATKLLTKRWSVLQFDEPVVTTSDNPVVVHNDIGVGITRPGTQIFFPISPKRVFLLDDLIAEPHWQFYPQDIETANRMNRLQWENSIHHLFSSRPMDITFNKPLHFHKSQSIHQSL